MILSLITFILVLGILVLVHEFGHFIVAKWSGMRVDEFAIGFPPYIIGIKKGETLYAINALPLGGYVRIHGENPEADAADPDPRSFQSRSIWARIAVIVAGVFMNLLFAFVVLTIAFSVGFSSVAQDLTTVPGATVLHNRVIVLPEKSSPADQAGLKEGDVVTAVTNLTTNEVKNISVAQDLQTEVKDLQAANQLNVKVDYTRDGAADSKTVALAATGPGLGVQLYQDALVRVPVWRAPGIAIKEVGFIANVTWQALKGFGTQLFGHGHLDQSVSGPIGIYQATASATHEGFAAVVFLMVALSINLALLNILPIPALDGGKLLFIILGAIFSRKVITNRLESIVTATGFSLVILLIIVLSVRDLTRL